MCFKNVLIVLFSLTLFSCVSKVAPEKDNPDSPLYNLPEIDIFSFDSATRIVSMDFVHGGIGIGPGSLSDYSNKSAIMLFFVTKGCINCQSVITTLKSNQAANYVSIFQNNTREVITVVVAADEASALDAAEEDGLIVRDPPNKPYGVITYQVPWPVYYDLGDPSVQLSKRVGDTWSGMNLYPLTLFLYSDSKVLETTCKTIPAIIRSPRSGLLTAADMGACLGKM